jgi:Fur family ferric uptake transcriptional regulator
LVGFTRVVVVLAVFEELAGEEAEAEDSLAAAAVVVEAAFATATELTVTTVVVELVAVFDDDDPHAASPTAASSVAVSDMKGIRRTRLLALCDRYAAGTPARRRPSEPGLYSGQHVLGADLIWIGSRKCGRLPQMPAAAHLEDMLREASLRVTRPRLAVLAAVHDNPHADTNSIIGLAREDLGEVSHQAVYDVLGALTAAGLVRRIHPEGSVARYESRVGDNHHHLVCRSCGAIADVDCAVGAAPCLTPADDHGYALEQAEVIYWGLCPPCSTRTSADQTDL